MIQVEYYKRTCGYKVSFLTHDNMAGTAADFSKMQELRHSSPGNMNAPATVHNLQELKRLIDIEIKELQDA